jgi:uncharacterized protein YcgI (DUF1989 family)
LRAVATSRSTRTASRWSTPGVQSATPASSCRWSTPALTRWHRPRGDVLRTNRRRPILTLVEDTSGGIHDTLIAACDRYRYAFLGVEGHHDNCADNLIAALADLGMTSQHVPSPLNLFMNIPWTGEGGLSFGAPPKPVPGSYVVLRAEMDLTIAFSACPQDIPPIMASPAGRSRRTSPYLSPTPLATEQTHDDCQSQERRRRSQPPPL